jgi:hypothetical protein
VQRWFPSGLSAVCGFPIPHFAGVAQFRTKLAKSAS